MYQVYIFWKSIQYTIHWGSTDKINVTKNVLFFLSRAPTHYSFTFNSPFLHELKHKVHFSKKCVWDFLFSVYRRLGKVWESLGKGCLSQSGRVKKQNFDSPGQTMVALRVTTKSIWSRPPHPFWRACGLQFLSPAVRWQSLLVW